MLKKEYKYFLFDLDRTLWDFDTNSKKTIYSLLENPNLSSIDREGFYKRYQQINYALWRQYELGRLNQEELKWQRFYQTLEEFGVKDRSVAMKLGREYLEQMPYQTTLMPHAYEVLEILHAKGYKIALVTNGFKEVQYKKLEISGIDKFFDAVMISQEQGVHKPIPIIFKRALNAIDGVKSQAIMVGDDFTNDIEGAMIFGIDQFFYNYKQIPCNGGPTYNSSSLKELIVSSTV